MEQGLYMMAGVIGIFFVPGFIRFVRNLSYASSKFSFLLTLVVSIVSGLFLGSAVISFWMGAFVIGGLFGSIDWICQKLNWD